MSFEAKLEQAIIDGAVRGLHAAAERAMTRARATEDGAVRDREMRNASAWTACADDVAAMGGDGPFVEVA